MSEIESASYETINNNQQPIESENSEWVTGKKCAAKTINRRFVINEPKGTFFEKPRIAKQTGRVHRNDWVADIAHVGDMLVMGASMRGSSHFGLNKVRQDAFSISEQSNSSDSKWIIAAIADGVSASPNAHFIADFMVRQTVVVAGEKLAECASLSEIDWNCAAQRLVDLSLEFCRAGVKQDSSVDIEKLSPERYASNWATTLEFIIVQATYDSALKSREFVHITVAGDGAAYILNKKAGWKVIKFGKERVGDKVNALPVSPANFKINAGHINKGECLILTTDGLSDFIGDGGSSLGGFFLDKLPKCNSLAYFLQIVDVSHFQMDDDRTLILIKEQE